MGTLYRAPTPKIRIYTFISGAATRRWTLPAPAIILESVFGDFKYCY